MTVTTRLTIARHGQARCNVDGRVGGPKTCTGLTDHGRDQIELLAARLAAQQRTGPAFDALYTGPRPRLQESGRILAHARPDQPYAPGSDSWNGYLTRAATHLAALLEHHQGQNILIAAHGETIHAAYHLLLQVPVQTSAHTGLGTNHAGLTRFERHHDQYGNQYWVLAVLNDTAHLNDRATQSDQ
ncbi:histidine phosphatase family protein [Streptomyces exfoliatus]|uniref:histidine phosphatase family protein n=1 Tax=Streptomyces exfoliatus TaxID=1905 RepID=UPI0004CDABE8|nr:histidine phosphatase family protein [Streptomyces exfoliatus]